VEIHWLPTEIDLKMVGFPHSGSPDLLSFSKPKKGPGRLESMMPLLKEAIFASDSM
jgi:hypothetical protein